jgi:hypothetical protein
VEKILTKIQKLRPSSVAGPDKIGPRLLQNLQREVAPILEITYRKTLDNGTMLKDYRSANLTPMFKKGTDPGNYCPVSLTSVCCKNFFVIRGDLMTHLLGNKLLTYSQHGFIFLDFAKAFDKVPHRRLLEKLRAHGTTGQLLKWIANWLSHRKRRVIVNG